MEAINDVLLVECLRLSDLPGIPCFGWMGDKDSKHADAVAAYEARYKVKPKASYRFKHYFFIPLPEEQS